MGSVEPEIVLTPLILICESSLGLAPLDIKTPAISHHKFNEHKSIEPIIQRLKDGQTIALISDAGTPAISDPG